MASISSICDLLLPMSCWLGPLLRSDAHSHTQQMQAASSGYAELMAMSDEFVLERARVSAC
jgi:hypothetical protein